MVFLTISLCTFVNCTEVNYFVLVGIQKYMQYLLSMQFGMGEGSVAQLEYYQLTKCMKSEL